MVTHERNFLWPVVAFLASIWAGILSAVLIGAIMAGPIQDSESLERQSFHYIVYGNYYGENFKDSEMEARIRQHARSLGIPDGDLICVLAECRQSQHVRPILYVRTTRRKGHQLWEFTQRAMHQELDRLKEAFPDSKKVDPSITKSNDCSER